MVVDSLVRPAKGGRGATCAVAWAGRRFPMAAGWGSGGGEQYAQHKCQVHAVDRGLTVDRSGSP
jgi:alpha-D-ribose 1-methylphosphonate 5-phosphate C-P lyase